MLGKISLKVIIPLTIIAAAMLLTAGFFLQKSRNDANLENRLKLGYKLISEGDYEEAVLLYNDILKIDMKNPRALTGLGIAYSAKGDYENAKIYLKKAIENDPEIVEAYDELSRIQIFEGDEAGAEQILDEAYNATKAAEIIPMKYRITERTLAGQIVDAASGASVQNAGISIYSGSNYENELMSTITGEDGSFSMKAEPGSYKLVITADGYNDTETYQKIGEDNMTYQAKVRIVKKEQDKEDSVTVVVTNAFTGKPINGSQLKVDFIPGIYSDIPPVDKSVLTADVGSNGKCTVSLPDGNYTALVTSSDNAFKPASAQVVVGGKENIEAIPLTPVIKDNEMRAVLTWSSTVDLDAFLVGKDSDGSDYRVFFKNKKYDGDTKVSLDVDVREGYGPETMTITLGDIGDNFTFYVDHFFDGRTSETDGLDTGLSKSGAKVVLYIGNNERKVFNVPTNKKGSTWKVFEVVDGEITASNYIGTSKMVGYQDDGLID